MRTSPSCEYIDIYIYISETSGNIGTLGFLENLDGNIYDGFYESIKSKEI